jgi:hypothetical protein
MKTLKSLQSVLLTLGLACGGAVALGAETPYPAQAPGYAAGPDYPAPYGGGLRALVDRTQSDLRAAEETEHNKGDQRERYQHAQGHLSTFDRKLTHGRFDKSELDKSIDSLKDILDHNVLQASSRDALLHDLEDLKMARERRY